MSVTDDVTCWKCTRELRQIQSYVWVVDMRVNDVLFVIYIILYSKIPIVPGHGIFYLRADDFWCAILFTNSSNS